MKPKTILVDVDSTLIDTLPPWLDAIAQKTGVRARLEDIKAWNFHKLPPLNTVNSKDVYDFLEDEKFLLSLELIPRARESVKELMDLGHTVLFPTARRGPVSVPATITWFKREMPFVDIGKQLIFIGDKWHLKADALIEDKGEALLEYGKRWPEALLTGIRYPYNEFAFTQTADWARQIVLFDDHGPGVRAWDFIMSFLSAEGYLYDLGTDSVD